MSIADGAEHADTLLILLRLTILKQHSPHPTDAQLLKLAATNRIEEGLKMHIKM